MDMPCRDIVVEVTQEDIENGVVNSPESCPIALALHRQIPNAMVIVCEAYNDNNIGEIDIILGDWCKRWKPSKAIGKFVKDFDDGMSVKPHRFYLKGGTQNYAMYMSVGCDATEGFSKEDLAKMYGL